MTYEVANELASESLIDCFACVVSDALARLEGQPIALMSCKLVSAHKLA